MDGGRLAGAVGAEEAVDLARGDREVDPVDRPRPLLELPHEALDLDPVVARMHGRSRSQSLTTSTIERVEYHRPQMSVAPPRSTDLARDAWIAMLEFFFAKARPRMLELWREFDLMPPQQMVLGLLDEPRPMGELAQQMHCDNSNITGIVDRLTERGLVERRAAEGDRRVKLVALTDAGRAIRERARSPARRAARGDRGALARPTCAGCTRSSPGAAIGLVDYAWTPDGGPRAPSSYLLLERGSRRVQQRRREASGRCRPSVRGRRPSKRHLRAASSVDAPTRSCPGREELITAGPDRGDLRARASCSPPSG